MDDDTDLPDPTYGYFITFAAPPPDVRNLPDARTDAEAIAAAVEVAQDRAAVVHLRRHTEDGTVHIGTATPTGAFYPPPQTAPRSASAPMNSNTCTRSGARSPRWSGRSGGNCRRVRCC